MSGVGLERPVTVVEAFKLWLWGYTSSTSLLFELGSTLAYLCVVIALAYFGWKFLSEYTPAVSAQSSKKSTFGRGRYARYLDTEIVYKVFEEELKKQMDSESELNSENLWNVLREQTMDANLITADGTLALRKLTQKKLDRKKRSDHIRNYYKYRERLKQEREGERFERRGGDEHLERLQAQFDDIIAQEGWELNRRIFGQNAHAHRNRGRMDKLLTLLSGAVRYLKGLFF